jgi:hypothetical protein
MAERPRLHDLLIQLETALHESSALSAEDRAQLGRLHADLSRALAERPATSGSPHSLRRKAEELVERLQIEHPRLASLLSATLDGLSDLGV